MSLFAAIILLLSGFSLSHEITMEGLIWFGVGLIMLSPSTWWGAITFIFTKANHERK